MAYIYGDIFTFFFSKNTCELDIVLTRTVKILTTNKLVKLTMLWRTGTEYLSFIATDRRG